MTTQFHKVLKLQGEIWYWSLLGFKTIPPNSPNQHHKKYIESNKENFHFGTKEGQEKHQPSFTKCMRITNLFQKESNKLYYVCDFPFRTFVTG